MSVHTIEHLSHTLRIEWLASTRRRSAVTTRPWATCCSACRRSMVRCAWMTPETALISTFGAFECNVIERCCAVKIATSSRNAALICWKTFSDMSALLTSNVSWAPEATVSGVIALRFRMEIPPTRRPQGGARRRTRQSPVSRQGTHCNRRQCRRRRFSLHVHRQCSPASWNRYRTEFPELLYLSCWNHFILFELIRENTSVILRSASN